MAELSAHWTERSLEDYLHRLSSDFVRQIETLLEQGTVSQTTLAKRLKVSEGRVSQVLNSPGNLTLKQIIKYARAMGQKVSVVTYEDNDPENRRGPIFPEIFVTCWERAGKPTDFFDLQPAEVAVSSARTLTQTPKYAYSPNPCYRESSTPTTRTELPTRRMELR